MRTYLRGIKKFARSLRKRAATQSRRRTGVRFEPLEERHLLAVTITNFQLSNDTGPSATDRITSDPSVAGSATGNPPPFGSAQVQFDHGGDGGPEGWTTISNGSFSYNPLAVDPSLEDYSGPFTIRYRTRELDAYGGEAAVGDWQNFDMYLDRGATYGGDPEECVEELCLGDAQASTETGSLTLAPKAGCETCGPTILPQSRSLENARPIVEKTLQWPNHYDMPDRFEAELTFGGLTGATVHYDATGLDHEDSLRFALQADVSSLPTGLYDWELAITGYDGLDDSTVHFAGKRMVVNRADSEFGPWMWPSFLDALVVDVDGAMLVRGDGTTGWFGSLGGGAFMTPSGHTSSLTENMDGSFTFSRKDGSFDVFNSLGLLVARTDANGESVTFAYTDADSDSVVDELSTVTDSLGRVITYAYDSGMLATVTDIAGNVTEYDYDPITLEMTLTEPDPDGVGPLAPPVHTYVFNADGLITSVTDPAGRETEYGYDFAGRVVQGEIDGDTWSLASTATQGLVNLNVTGYDAMNPAAASTLLASNVATYTNERNETTTYVHNAFGQPVSMTNALGQTWTFERDKHGRVTTLTEPDPDGVGPLTELETLYEYDAMGNLLQVTYADSSQESWTYDATFNRVTSHTDPENRLTLYEIDEYTGNILSVTQVVGEIDDGINLETDDVTTSFTYTDGTGDLPVGLLLTMTDPLGRITEYAYQDDDLEHDFGWLLSITYAVGTADEASVSFEYDLAGNVTAEIDELGRRTEYEYNALNQLVKTTLADPDAGGPLSSPEILYAYCLCGIMNSVTDALGNETTYEFDDHRRLEKITQPDPDGVTPFDHPETTYAYDEAGNVISQTDALGRVTEYEYDELNRLVKMILPDPDGVGGAASPEWDYTYDHANNLTSKTDPLGNVTSYRYDERHRLVEITEADPDGVGGQSAPVTSFTYDASGLRTSMTDPMGRVTTYEYDDLGRLVKITQPDPDGGGGDQAPEYAITYDKVGNVLSQTDALGRVTSYEYDNLNRMILVVQHLDHLLGDFNRDGTVTNDDTQAMLDALIDLEGYKAVHELSDAQLLAIGDINHDGIVNNGDIQPFLDLLTAGGSHSPEWEYGYDDASQLISMTDPLGNATTYEYDLLGRLILKTLPDPDGGGGLTAPAYATSYDAMNNVLTQTDALGNTTTYSYDKLYRLLTVTEPDPDGGGGLSSPVTSYTYDLVGQMLTEIDPIGRTTTYAYDNLGRLNEILSPDPDGVGADLAPRMTYAYDAANNLVTETNRLGNETSYGYDNLYRLTSIANPNTETTTYTYDPVGNRLTLTDAELNTTIWVYDNLNRVIQEENELGDSRYFVYDLVGNLIEKTDRNEGVTRYEYDDLNRRTIEKWMNGSNVDHMLVYSFDNASRMLFVGDAFAEYEYEYDNLGRATSIAATINGLTPTAALTQAFDAGNQRTQLTATIGATADFQSDYLYDNLNRMTRFTQQDVMGGNAMAEKRVDFAYLADGQFDQIFRYADLAGTDLVVTSNYGYDDTGRLASLINWKDETLFSEYYFGYDAANRMYVRVNLAHYEVTEYEYDDAGQLVEADSIFSPNDESYTYDDNGNRIGGGYSTTANNRLESDGTYDYEYDGEGNVILRTKISDGSYTLYEWDHRNRLTNVTDFDDEDEQIQQVTYTYDAFNRMVSRTLVVGEDDPVSGYFIYDGNQITLVLDEDGNVEHRLLWGPAVDQILAEENGAGDVYWLLTDNQNTVHNVVEYDAGLDETNLVNHIVYDSFGNKLSETDDSLDMLDINFTGRYFDEATGLQYNHNRWYDPNIGRWLSQDPIGFDAGDANLYRYVANSPTNFTDPTGLVKADEKDKEWPDIHIDGPYGGTPQEPIGDGVAISIFGQEDNPKYKDYSSDPDFDDYQRGGKTFTRPNTSTLKDCTVSDISIRSSPILPITWKEILRISKPDAVVTISGPYESIIKLLRELEDGKHIEGFEYTPNVIKVKLPVKDGNGKVSGYWDGGLFHIRITRPTGCAKK